MHHGIIVSLIIGLIIGAIAKMLTPGRDPGGCFLTILLGLAGSAFGGYLGHILGFYEPDQPAGFVGSVVGAILLLLIYRMIFGKKA